MWAEVRCEVCHFQAWWTRTSQTRSSKLFPFCRLLPGTTVPGELSDKGDGDTGRKQPRSFNLHLEENHLLIIRNTYFGKWEIDFYYVQGLFQQQFIFVFISTSLGGGSKRILLWFMSYSVLPMFSSKSFIVSGLTIRSLIHFEFIFVYGVRECSNFIFLHVAVQFSQHHLLKRLSFLHCIFLPPLSKIKWPYVHGFITGLSILFNWSILLFLCQYHTVLIL